MVTVADGESVVLKMRTTGKDGRSTVVKMTIVGMRHHLGDTWDAW